MDEESSLHPGNGSESSFFVGQMLLKLQKAVYMTTSGIRQRVIQSFVVFSVVLLLLWIAAFLYGSLYYSYMPNSSFSTPVHYYYRTDCESPASFLCSYPVANISLMRNRKHVLTFGQAYHISLKLEMPDSLTNQALGMFMIKTAFYSQDGGQVASSAWSARQVVSACSSRFSMLRYRTDLLRVLETLLFLPALLSGATEQKQMLEVELFSDYTDSPYAPSVTAVIEILSSKVQIYSSQLYIHAHFTGLRYLLFNFPILSALVGVSSNFIFLSVILVLSYMRLLLTSPVQLRTDGPLSDRERNISSNQQDDEKDDEAGAAEMVGSRQITSTNLSDERPHLHFGDGTEVHGRSEIIQLEAA